MNPSLSPPVQADARVLAEIVSAQTEMAAAMPDSDAVMRVLARRAMALTEATGASIAVRDGDELFFPVNEGFTAGWENARYTVASTLTGHCVITGELYSVPDLYEV